MKIVASIGREGMGQGWQLGLRTLPSQGNVWGLVQECVTKAQLGNGTEPRVAHPGASCTPREGSWGGHTQDLCVGQGWM